MDDSALEDAKSYLTTLLNKTLRIHTTDKRMFLGQFKCTDSDRNIILAQTFEYRLPAPPSPSKAPSAKEAEKTSKTEGKVRRDLISRYLGLVVVPGEYVTKIEVEEFVSQVGRGGGSG